jgi:Cd2+/Zn2+-exporting ATPase
METPHATPAEDAHACGCSHDHSPAAPMEPISATPAKAGVARFRIPTMDCAAEEAEIRHALAKLPGLRSLSFQLGARTIAIDAPSESLPQALEAMRKAGFKPTPISEGQADGHHEHDHHGHSQENHTATSWMPQGPSRFGLALAFAFAAESIAYFAPASLATTLLGMGVAAVAIALSGLSTYVKGIAALRNARLNINALMTVAVTGAFLIGQWPEAAMVMALYAIAELIEARSIDKARNAIKGLLDLTPEVAEVRAPDGTWSGMPVQNVTIDAVIRVKPGERVPLDAVIVVGETAVDQSSVTGESIPVDKAVGDAVFAGTINTSATFEARVTAIAGDTLLARIIHAVEQAQGSRAPTQQFVDKFASIYTPSVFGIALMVALLGPLLLDWTFAQAIYKALVLLVIACPCALVISTPVTVVSGLAAAARRGILIKGGVHLESARKIKAIALDKTGTITEGKPQLVASELLDAEHTEDQIFHWAADMASHSDHPVSQAIARGLDGHKCDGDLADFKALAGRGIQAQAHGVHLVLGNHRLIEEMGICSPEIEARLAVHEREGRTITLLATSDKVIALFAVADTIKQSSREAIADLHTLGVSVSMLTGDNTATARAIGAQAGIMDARGDMLPEAKLEAIEALRANHGFVAMVGDGINDAPALARSDIGFAMGGAGTDIAMEASDVVIMNDDLRRIPETIRLSQKTHAVLVQNIAVAMGIKAVFLGMAVFGEATMWMAVFADMGASLIVVANGLRLMRTPKD